MAGAALQRVLVDSWLRRGALAWLLAPIALVYGRLVAARRWLYSRQILQAHGVRVPVLVVGNVVAGGGGKTPLVLAIVRHLQQRGLTVGVVSRGYGRPGRHGLEVTGSSTAADVGDEPVLIHRSTGAFVHVAARRIDAARALLDNHPAIDILVWTTACSTCKCAAISRSVSLTRAEPATASCCLRGPCANHGPAWSIWSWPTEASLMRPHGGCDAPWPPTRCVRTDNACRCAHWARARMRLSGLWRASRSQRPFSRCCARLACRLRAPAHCRTMRHLMQPSGARQAGTPWCVPKRTP